MNRRRTVFQTLEGPRNTGTLILGLLLCCAALLPTPGFGATYQVKQGGSADFGTIQAAIDAAVDGDELVVHTGTYYENIHFDGKNITLRSLDPEDEETVASTIIDGGQNDSVVTFRGTEDDKCLLSGFTITNGKSNYGGGILGGDPWSHPPVWACAGITNCAITGNRAYNGGGGLYGYNGTIRNCTITANGADWGGGLCLCGGTIRNCTISGNSATWGGGLIYCDGTISNCTISGNSATWGGGLWGCNGTISKCTVGRNSATGREARGGGLYWCNATITNCTISGNSATGECAGGGGLVYCDGPITNCTISGNSAEYGGGGLVYCDGPISNCAIAGNSATGDYGYGGGLYRCAGGITNCTISANSATGDYGYGGGLYGCAGPITNCTISGNSAAWGGGLFYCGGPISNCIVWGNEAEQGRELHRCQGLITHCCIQDWASGGEGNISDDPLFVTGPLGDYYLSCAAAGQAADSPCIDAGSDTAESLGLDEFTTSTNGVPDAGIVDMGYHYPPTPQQNPYIESSVNYPGEFAPGDLLVGFIEVHNPGADFPVDVYVAFVLPNGTVVSLTSSGLTIGIHPWASNVVLPTGLHFGPSEVIRTTVPQSPGSYLFAAALTEPGQLEFIGEPSLFPFTIRERSSASESLKGIAVGSRA
ncbi:MAG TPA: right-handed parallel beta-helix repeat-containing protein [bacterium]|nr:right-handed parallel beta-helix repeat-containing protein [bacterium]